jgi:hypothetical protein
VTEVGQEAADFAIAALVEHHFQERRVLPPTLDAHLLGLRKALGQMDAALELAGDVVVDVASNLDLINLLDAVPRVRESVGQLAVIGDENQPFA